MPEPYVNAPMEITEPGFGVINSNYRIQSTIVTVKDAAGNVVYDKQGFVGVDLGYPNNRGELTTVNLSESHYALKETLKPGAYTFTVKVLLANGEEHTVAENVSYIKE